MRTMIVAAVCLLSLGLFPAPAPAETFVLPAPDLVGQYSTTSITEILFDFDVIMAMWEMEKDAYIDAGTQFQGITQVKVHLVGTMQSAWNSGDPIEGGGGNCPTSLYVSIGSTSNISQHLSGPFDCTLTFPITQAGGSMLAGTIPVSVSAVFEPTVSVGGGGHIYPPSFTVTSASVEITGTHAPGTLKADFNGDDSVDVVDLLTFIDTFGLAQGDPGYNPACDLSGDNSVDVVDLLTFVGLFGNPR